MMILTNSNTLMYYNGKVVRITDIATPQGLLGVIEADYTQLDQIYVGTSILIPFGQMEPIIDHKFQIGDTVRSLMSDEASCFVGTVIGFEYDTNSAICRSEKIANYGDKKVRYAYKANDLEKYDESDKPHCEFKHGMNYIVNNKSILTAVYSTELTGYFNLVDIANGKTVYKNIDGKSSVRNLYRKHRIANVRPL